MKSPIARLALIAITATCLVLAPSAVGVASASPAKATPYGGTTDLRPGGHGDLTTGVTYDYGDNTSESVKRILIDTPVGGVGNPNAVPWADRCTKAQFEKSTCPAKSQIGVVTISAVAYAIGFIPIPMNDMTGTISEIQTDPEVPTLVGAYIQPSIGDPIRSYARFYPVTSGPDGDFRIRTETSDFPRTAKALGLDQRIQITKYEQKLFGVLKNGNTFITNPTRCDTWFAGGYDEYWDSSAGADSDPLMTGKKTWFKGKPVPTTPDCKQQAPLTVTADAKADGPVRGDHAALTTTIDIPGLGGKPLGAAVPKAITVTLPKALTIDVMQLGRICSDADFAASSCPATTQVGNARIEIPSIAAGLDGEVFLVKASPGHNLPDLGVRVHGAINFNLRGTARFVNGNQLQTTFDNNPQTGFSSFQLNLTGGPRGLLLVRECPAGGEEPGDGGPVRFDVATYQGQSTSFNSTTSFTPPSCLSYSVSVKSVKKCLRKRSLTIKPSIKSPGIVRYVKYYVAGKYVKKSKRKPFKVRVNLAKKLRTGKTYRYKAKVYFKPTPAHPNGRKVTKTAKFKLCP